MADAFSHTPKLQRLYSQDSSNHSNPSNFSYNFMYKAVIVTILLLLPLFPSHAPETINQTLHARSWELLQLIFVGIAVSYGIFSKKNDEMGKDHGSKSDNSKLLQVSSVFYDETENQTVVDENKVHVQTWNSQYYRGEPIKVVAKESPISVQEQNATSSGVSQKPLLLPVRSLKQHVAETVEIEDSTGKSSSLISKSRSNSVSKRFTSSSSKNSRNEEVEGISPVNLEEKVEDNVVLRSPIPWRSRSGRMQMKENGNDLPTNSMEEPEFSSLESPSFRSSRPNSTCSTPKNLLLSPSISSSKMLSSISSTESQAKTSEDLMRKNNSHEFSPPPPPPPPPPPHLRKFVLMKPNSSVLNDEACSEKKLWQSVTSVPMQESRETGSDEPPGRATFRSDFKVAEVGSDDFPFVCGKSVRTIRRSEFKTEKKSPQQYKATIFADRSKGYTNKSMQENVSSKKEPITEKFIVETSDDDDYYLETEFEDDYFEESSSGSNGEPASTNANDSANDVGSDVDKKADEFIAKVREQIRLQRIESIRRSTKQRAAANTWR